MSDNGWPGEPGVPMNPERGGWHWCQITKNVLAPIYWNTQNWWDIDSWNGSPIAYIAPVLTPAEVDARVAQARRDALEEAARWHDEQASEAQRLSDIKVSALDSKVWGDYAQNHREYAAAIRALKGEVNE